MKNEQVKPMYYDGSGTIQLSQTTAKSKDIIIKPVGVITEHVQIPYFPY
ncbi:hypothetical protein [Paenibacillus qinlingensis]|nr:hypothetical protein [Paenibacillus qinlingensis]NQX60336.1 hypothetical protein [Paenibacillus qinlingensis]